VRTNYHTHCDFCDGKASASDMAEAAWRAGYAVLGFSSHAPLPFPSTWTLPRERLPAYLAEIGRLKAAWEGRMEILLGLEIDHIAGLVSPRDPAFLELDFRIGSTHFIELGGGRFTVDEPAEEFDGNFARYAGGDGSLVWKAYYRSLAEMIAAGGFDIVAHFDLVRKNNTGGRLFDEEDPAYLAAAFEAAAQLRGSGIVAEINVGSMARGKMKSPYPSLPLLKEFRRLGVPITISADAHAPAHLGTHLDAAKDLAKAAGYRSAAVLTKGKWIEVGIDET
jgi:histidinol-phosphatase (PHP family)